MLKKCALNKLGEMGEVILFVFLLNLFAISLMAFHIVKVLLSVSTSLSKYALLAERTKLFTVSLLFKIIKLVFLLEAVTNCHRSNHIFSKPWGEFRVFYPLVS